MSDYLTIIIVVLTLFYVLYRLSTGKRKKVATSAHQWWLNPWLALVYALLMYLVYYRSDFHEWSLVEDIVEEHHVDNAYLPEPENK